MATINPMLLRKSCGAIWIDFWLALIGADQNWPVLYSSRIDGCLLPMDGERSCDAP